MTIGIDYTNKRITVDALITVNALYSSLMNTFDEQGAMDDTIPMSAQTPTEYTMTNEWFIDDTSTHYLYQGAIKTSGYNGKIQVVTMQLSGYTSCVAGDIGLVVHATGEVNYGILLAYNNTTRKWWVRGTTQLPTATDYHVHTGAGIGTSSAASATGEDLYANVYTLGSIESGTLIYVYQAGSKIDPDWWDEGHIDILVKVEEAGTQIANDIITLYARVWTDLYDHYQIGLTAGGRNAVPVATANDLDNATANLATVGNYVSNIKVVFPNGTVAYSAKTGDNLAVGACLICTGSTQTGSGFVLSYSASETKLGNVTGSFTVNKGLQVAGSLKYYDLQGRFSQNTLVSGST